MPLATFYNKYNEKGICFQVRLTHAWKHENAADVYSTATIEVEAETEEQALNMARERVSDEEILESLIEENSPDIEEI